MLILLSLLIFQAVVGENGCVNNTIQSTAGYDYGIYCDVDWPSNDLNHLVNVTDLFTCINICDSWNLQSNVAPCVGVSLGLRFAPNQGCWLKYNMPGAGVNGDNVVDSALRDNNHSVIGYPEDDR